MAKGILRSGDQLPSEAQMCQHFDVSPMTIRRAINSLIDQGVVVAEQGRGTFVKQITMTEATFQLKEFQDLIQESDNVSVQILEASIKKTNRRAARKLKISLGEKTVFIRRVIRKDNLPVLYHREFLLYDLSRPIVESELEVTNLQRLFSGKGDPILKYGDIRIDPTLLREDEAQILQIDLPAATFCLQHVFFDFDDKPVSWGWFIGHPDVFKLATRVGLLTNGEERS
jgi:GntR family transcriptional regulator